MSATVFPIEQEIYEALNAKAKELYRDGASDTQWTAEFKSALCDLVKENKGLQAWASSISNSDGAEWLWDVCWACCSKDEKEEWWKTFRGVFLACEIEWNPTPVYVMGDFLKLAVAVADFRVFVCTLDPDKEDKDTLDELQNACPGPHGARYLVIGVPTQESYDEGRRDLPYRAWTCTL